MAKQKSGLGRGLNALFDDSSLSMNQSRKEQNEEIEAKKEVSTASHLNSAPSVEKNVPTASQNSGSRFTEEATKNRSHDTDKGDNHTFDRSDAAAKQANVASKNSNADSKVITSNQNSGSSSIYFSEDALENAKVVSREARQKPTFRETSRPERTTGFFQRKSTKSVPQPPQPASQSVRTSNHSTQSPHKITPSVSQAPSFQTSTGEDKKPVNTDLPQKPKEEKGSTGVVPLDKVQPNPDQPRTNFKQEEIEELANSIKKEGLLQPILVRKVGDHYQIIAGERRWQACKALKMKEIPVRFWAADNDKALELALIENIQRTDLNPIEEAYGYKRLMERRGMTQSEVAQTVSKGRSTIANALRLLDLPEEAQQLLFEEKITAGHARAILSIPDAEGRKTLTNKLMNEKLSVRETESIARLLSGRAQSKEDRGKKRTPAPASFKKAARGLTRFLSVPVRVKTVQGKNKIEIQFKDEEELERIINLIAENAQESNERASEAEK